MSKQKNYQYYLITKDELMYKHLYQIPPRKGRYIVIDTETTGLKHEDHIIEIGACEIANGLPTGQQFHIYIRPRLIMEEVIVNIHGITNKFYDDYYKDIYSSDKQNLINFMNWVGDSIVFAHNAPFDMIIINKELYFWGLHEIPITRYRCSMRIFREIASKYDPLFDEKYYTLEKCCEYFGIRTDKVFHNALYDSYMTAKLICKLYARIDSNPELSKEFNYYDDSLESHYQVYKKQKIANFSNNNYYCDYSLPNNNNLIVTPPKNNNSNTNNNNKKVKNNNKSTTGLNEKNGKEKKNDTKENNNKNDKENQNTKENSEEKDKDNNEGKNHLELSNEIVNKIFQDL